MACPEFDFEADRVREVVDALLTAYFRELRHGSARWLEQETVIGPVHELLATATESKRKDFLDSRATKTGEKRELSIDGKRALPARKKSFAHAKRQAMASLVIQKSFLQWRVKREQTSEDDKKDSDIK